MVDRRTYLANVVAELCKQRKESRVVNIVCHGHSVPAGFFTTPVVNMIDAYPHQLFLGLKQRFPFATVNVIVSAKGYEDSSGGAARFEAESLCHRPDVVMLDYGLNDRRIGLDAACGHWNKMIEAALGRNIKVLLLTPTLDIFHGRKDEDLPEDKRGLPTHAEQIRRLAEEYKVGLADIYALWEAYLREGDISDLLSYPNHPNAKGHELIAKELLRWFPVA